MEVIINAFCFLFGILMGIIFRGSFTINYRHTYKDDTIQHVEIKEPIGYKTEDKKNDDVDSPAELAEKIQEALGVFMNDEPEERK